MTVNKPMLIELNYKSGRAPYLQIVEQVKHAAASGAIRVGEALPGIRPLAESLKVNRNTVAKAYTELERQGIVETRAGKGCFISVNNTPFNENVRRDILIEALDNAIVQAHHLQYDHPKFRKLFEERLTAFEKRSKRKD